MAGGTNVGKSSIILRLSDNIFNESFLPTIGIDFKIKHIQMAGKNNKL
jgi:Ras-related protein Rab-1A